MTTERELAVLSESIRNIEKSLEEAKESRKLTYGRLEGMDRKLDHLDWRVGDLEKKLILISPTVEEFARYKMQVSGAGWFGRLLWKIGGILLAIASGAVTAWAYLSTYFTLK